MTILGLWAALIGYAILYAGLANWEGGSMSLAQAFTGQGTTSAAPSSGNQLDPFAPGQPYTGPNAPGPTTGEPSGYNPQTGQYYAWGPGSLGNVGP